MKKILKKVKPVKVIEKWKMGIKKVFKKYDEGSVSFVVDKKIVTLMFNEIVSLISDKNYTIYNMRNGKSFKRLLGIGLCCLDLPRDHYGRYCKAEVVNLHYCCDYSRGKICTISLSGGRSSIVSRNEKDRFKEDIRLFKIRETLRAIRNVLKKNKNL